MVLGVCDAIRTPRRSGFCLLLNLRIGPLVFDTLFILFSEENDQVDTNLMLNVFQVNTCFVRINTSDE